MENQHQTNESIQHKMTSNLKHIKLVTFIIFVICLAISSAYWLFTNDLPNVPFVQTIRHFHPNANYIVTIYKLIILASIVSCPIAYKLTVLESHHTLTFKLIVPTIIILFVMSPVFLFYGIPVGDHVDGAALIVLNIFSNYEFGALIVCILVAGLGAFGIPCLFSSISIFFELIKTNKR